VPTDDHDARASARPFVALAPFVGPHCDRAGAVSGTTRTPAGITTTPPSRCVGL
jgi:hypothetical protein